MKLILLLALFQHIDGRILTSEPWDFSGVVTERVSGYGQGEGIISVDLPESVTTPACTWVDTEDNKHLRFGKVTKQRVTIITTGIGHHITAKCHITKYRPFIKWPKDVQ